MVSVWTDIQVLIMQFLTLRISNTHAHYVDVFNVLATSQASSGLSRRISRGTGVKGRQL